jgi:hypothetical protein
MQIALSCPNPGVTQSALSQMQWSTVIKTMGSMSVSQPMRTNIFINPSPFSRCLDNSEYSNPVKGFTIFGAKHRVTNPGTYSQLLQLSPKRRG